MPGRAGSTSAWTLSGPVRRRGWRRIGRVGTRAGVVSTSTAVTASTTAATPASAVTGRRLPTCPAGPGRARGLQRSRRARSCRVLPSDEAAARRPEGEHAEDQAGLDEQQPPVRGRGEGGELADLPPGREQARRDHDRTLTVAKRDQRGSTAASSVLARPPGSAAASRTTRPPTQAADGGQVRRVGGEGEPRAVSGARVTRGARA